ncbi:MAG: CPBP family intramembrane metalloprotease [Candidatus Thorarchaeota archaeon]|jgi:membrane protease YdiL (CAAX protease family)
MNFDNSSDGKKETLESIFLFIAPIIIIIPFYILNILQDIYIAYYLIYLTYILGSVLILKANHHELREIGISSDNLKESMLLACGFVIAYVVAQALGSEMHLATNLTPLSIVEQIIFNFLFSGPGQEILFRGIMFFSIWRWKGWKAALAVTSILFGFAHLLKGIRYIAATVLIGLIYGYVTYRTKNIVGPMMAHGLNNFILGFILVV